MADKYTLTTLKAFSFVFLDVAILGGIGTCSDLINMILLDHELALELAEMLFKTAYAPSSRKLVLVGYERTQSGPLQV